MWAALAQPYPSIATLYFFMRVEVSLESDKTLELLRRTWRTLRTTAPAKLALGFESHAARRVNASEAQPQTILPGEAIGILGFKDSST